MKITPIEFKALGRFRECCEDSAAGGHDVPKEMMQRLAAVGVVRTLGFGRHETTEFGDWLLAQPPEAKVSAMAVTAAAPQVVADEPLGYINPAFLTERRNEFEQNGTVMFAWQCGECTSPIYGTAAPVQAQEPRKTTDLSTRLRSYIAQNTVPYPSDVLAAADEIERYYGGMMNWKATAEAKDRAPVQPVAMPVAAKPITPAICPITGRKFWGNIDHPERGLVATYGGPLDTYSIPYLSNDNELRVERFDQDAGDWVEGGEPCGWYSDEQPDAAPAAQGDAEADMFLRGVIAALGALAPHCQHGDVIHDEIVRSVGKEALYRTAEPEDVVWAGLDPEFYAAIAAKAVTQ